MARYDFTSVRLHVEDDLAEGGRLVLDQGRSNYLRNVMRLSPGDGALLFNGRDGEWRGRLADAGRRSVAIDLVERTRSQDPLPDLHYLFAPLKQARLDYLVQKAVEMGAGRLRPVLTRRTQVRRLGMDRMVANVREACEQCGVIAVPAVDEPIDLERALAGWAAAEPGRVLVVCDEAGSARPENPVDALADVVRGTPLAVIVGPEGGFSPEEQAMLSAVSGARIVALGPRILRADTAAVAALAIVQAVAGDWAPCGGREGPRSRNVP